MSKYRLFFRIFATNYTDMDLRKLLSFKDWFSYRQKVGLLVVAGVVCGKILNEIVPKWIDGKLIEI